MSEEHPEETLDLVDSQDREWLTQFWAKANYAAGHFGMVLEYARTRLLSSGSLSAHDREQVNELAELLFHSVTPQVRAVEVSAWNLASWNRGSLYLVTIKGKG